MHSIQNGSDGKRLVVRRFREIERQADSDGKKIVAILYMRLSGYEQRNGGSGIRRLKKLRRWLKRSYGITPTKTFSEVRCGRFFVPSKRPELIAALQYARKVQAQRQDAVVVVLSDWRNRFLRAKKFDGRPETDIPSAEQWRTLAALSHGVVLATRFDPERLDSRSYETLTNRKCGRPRGRKNTQADLIGMAWKLHQHDLGIPTRAIARFVKLPESNLRYHFAKLRKNSGGCANTI